MEATPNHVAEYTKEPIQAGTLPMDEHSTAQREQSSPSISPERLATTERLLVSGELLFSLARELNTVVMDMSATLQQLQREPLSPTAHKLATTMLEGRSYATRLLQAALAFADDTPAPQRSDADQVLQTAIDLLTPLARDRGIQIVPHAPPALELPLSPRKAQQVLLHLLLNSVQAIPQDDQQAHTIWVNVVAWDTSVVISVRDDGPGIPDTIRPYIFDVFFSTKSPTSSTGLGLAIVRAILQQIGGDISVTDTRPGSTTFTVWLPRSSSRVSAI
jgi:two-component system C4-dicarboxylate transport sensor histidine kinase DctB